MPKVLKISRHFGLSPFSVAVKNGKSVENHTRLSKEGLSPKCLECFKFLAFLHLLLNFYKSITF